MKTCYIHIGIHKTGSTAIQHSLARHRMALLEHGLHVPRAGLWSDSPAAHHNLAFDLNLNPSFDRAKGGLEELITELRTVKCDNVLVSSEDLAFSVRHPARLRRLREPLLDLGFRIRWIVYFRTFPEWAESAYTELAKSLRVRSPFSEWVRSNPRALILGNDPCEALKHLRKTGDDVLLRSYAEALPNLLADFYSLIGIHGTVLGPDDHEQRVNQRVSVFAMEFLMRLAALPGLEGDPERALRMREIATQKLPELPPGPSYRGLVTGLARNLYQITRPSYRKLLKQFRPEASFEELFPLAPEYRQSTLETHDAQPEELLQLYRTITDLCLEPADS